MSFLSVISLLLIANSTALLLSPGRQMRVLSRQQLMMNSLVGPSFRVSNLERSVNFYSKVLGMKVAEKKSSGSVVLSIDGETGASPMSIELTADSSVTLGDGYAGIGVRVASAGNIIQAASKEGGKVILEVGDFAYAASMIPDEDEMRNTAVRYGRIADPDGYVVEVKEDAKLSPSASKLFKVVLNVIDIDESIPFYQDLLGMKLLRKRSNVMGKPKEASMCAYMGFNDEVNGCFLELNYNYATDKLSHGSGFSHATIAVSDIDAVKRAAAAAGKSVDGVMPDSMIVRDPNDYAIFVKKN